jgi:hypothetical protein
MTKKTADSSKMLVPSSSLPIKAKQVTTLGAKLHGTKTWQVNIKYKIKTFVIP